MKPPPFRYHDPKTVSEAVGLLASLENAKLLAGGQSLMPMLNMRFVLPDHIIDLNRVEGLSHIRDTQGALDIGAMTRQRDLEFSETVRARWPTSTRRPITGSILPPCCRGARSRRPPASPTTRRGIACIRT